MKVLLVEDNIQISANIIRYLSLYEITCDSSLNWVDGLNKIFSHHYDVIILDINLPEMNGLDVLKHIRERWMNTQVIMLTSNSQKEDIIEGLNLWADDYITKPFDFAELLARLHSVNRRNFQNKANRISFWKDYVIDFDTVEVTQAGKVIKLSPLEFNLLKYLIQNEWRSISRQELYEKVWGEFSWDIMFSKTVDVYIWYIRKKLFPDIIETVKWVWYKINKLDYESDWFEWYKT